MAWQDAVRSGKVSRGPAGQEFPLTAGPDGFRPANGRREPALQDSGGTGFASVCIVLCCSLGAAGDGGFPALPADFPMEPPLALAKPLAPENIPFCQCHPAKAGGTQADVV